MTTAFGALLVGLVGAALIVALIAFLWVNRTPSTNERFDEYGRVPLFGVDLSGTAASAGQPVGMRLPVEVNANVPSGSEVAASASPPGTHVELPFLQQQGAAGSLSQPVAPDATALESMNGSAPVSDSLPANGNRIGGGGWGPNRGWPAPPEPTVTPRFVPPVRERRATPPSVPSTAMPANGNGVYADGVAGSMVEGHRLRFSTPMEGTLQFLPGRLEISSGLDTGREIRFVRLPGPNGTEVTFGRNEGPLYRHIQLRDQTVSREHARMTLVDGRWLLTNLSNTNPVAHNGRVLSAGEHQALDDGDRLEMGEVEFSFRSR